jgi:hypothetical protein
VSGNLWFHSVYAYTDVSADLFTLHIKKSLLLDISTYAVNHVFDVRPFRSQTASPHSHMKSTITRLSKESVLIGAFV